MNQCQLFGSGDPLQQCSSSTGSSGEGKPAYEGLRTPFTGKLRLPKGAKLEKARERIDSPSSGQFWPFFSVAAVGQIDIVESICLVLPKTSKSPPIEDLGK